jgi:hypothetical protein
VKWALCALSLILLSACTDTTYSLRGSFGWREIVRPAEGSEDDAECEDAINETWSVAVYAEDSGRIIAEDDDPLVTVEEMGRLSSVSDLPSDVYCEVTGTFLVSEVPEEEFYTVVGPGFCELVNYSEKRVTLDEARDSGFRVKLECPTDL